MRDHSHDLPKKVCALGLKHALSAKAKDGTLIVIDNVAIKDAKTKAFREQLKNLGFASTLIVDGAEGEKNLGLAARNVPHVDVLPVQGIHVYDILRHDPLVLSKAAVDALEERFQ